MFPWWSLLLLLGLLHLGRCDTNQILEKCLNYMVCEEEGGLDRAEECISVVSQPDKDFIVEMYSKFYEGVKTYRDAGDISCAGPFDLRRDAAYYYYGKLFDKGLQLNQSLDDKRRVVEARECLFAMASECKDKHEMGLV